ncbi:hypothetical protein [Pseudomonas poae]|uniref:Uncharacterized protein n=1 Tax=Pseudomonas poae TaxID=200451 RepID=A0A2S9E8E4_9PSED|nr:hypothetical protein [Pseudomonas poae]PRA21228.1 hypothetical protein CQZ97_28185 [Pseudomonas poae]PRC11112.1 hypothetical protein CQZ99_26865 [Pseudomonas poae]
MSCYSIKNVARVVDVRQVLAPELLNASNEVAPCNNQGRVDFTPKPLSTVPRNEVAVRDNSGVLNSLVSLFTSFFTQLISLISNEKDRVVPDVAPRPEVKPAVVPAPPTPEVLTRIPGLSDKRNGAKPENIWSGFRQGPDGNCVTVSAIKAAMYKFGQSPTDIFKEVSRLNDGYRVTMRDDFVLTLTDRELAVGARGSRFIGPDGGMLKDAQFLFAVSAKRAEMENNDGAAGRSYEAGVRSLNDGEDERGPGEGLYRLGLRKHMRRVGVRDLANGQLGMCNRTGHSVAVINGREELWGRQGSAPTRGDAIALV